MGVSYVYLNGWRSNRLAPGRLLRNLLPECQGAGRLRRHDAAVLVVLGIRLRIKTCKRSREPALVEDLVVRLPLRADRVARGIARPEERSRTLHVALRRRETGEGLEADRDAVSVAEVPRQLKPLLE